MEKMHRKGIPVGCRNGGCGVCKVKARAGYHGTTAMSRSVITEEAETDHCALACRVIPLRDMTIEPIGKMARLIEAHQRKASGDDPGVSRETTQPKEDLNGYHGCIATRIYPGSRA